MNKQRKKIIKNIYIIYSIFIFHIFIFYIPYYYISYSIFRRDSNLGSCIFGTISQRLYHLGHPGPASTSCVLSFYSAPLSQLGFDTMATATAPAAAHACAMAVVLGFVNFSFFAPTLTKFCFIIVSLCIEHQTSAY